MGRCAACNAADFRLLDRAAAAGRAPPAMLESELEVFECGACGKTYWMGPKSFAALALVEGRMARARLGS